MGLGDDLLFLGEAERIHNRTSKKIQLMYGITGWNDWNGLMFNNVDFLTKNPTPDSVSLNGADTLAKTDYHVNYYSESSLGQAIRMRHYKPKNFKLRFSTEQIERANELIAKYNIPDTFCAINPDYKTKAFGKNKDWGFQKFQKITNRLIPDIPVVRISPGIENNYNSKPLKNAIDFSVTDYMTSFAILSKAKFGVSFMGFFVHAFGGFRIPCVTIHGGLSHESIMDYEGNINFSYDHPDTPCGRMFPCKHCTEGNKSITVDMIYDACKKLI